MLSRALIVLSLFLSACERTPEPHGHKTPQAGETQTPQAEESHKGGDDLNGDEASDEITADQETEPQRSSGETKTNQDSADCLVPLADAPPPKATSLKSCPPDPEGKPEMPLGTVKFVDADNAPQLKVELALTDKHRRHGLMFRPDLSDSEGMLFTFEGEEVRSFWMHNTCLALDMLFIEESGHISGILEQVPPWNDERRRLSCPVKHVLEVRAGWARDHGVAPGQKVIIEPASDDR